MRRAELSCVKTIMPPKLTSLLSNSNPSSSKHLTLCHSGAHFWNVKQTTKQAIDHSDRGKLTKRIVSTINDSGASVPSLLLRQADPFSLQNPSQSDFHLRNIVICNWQPYARHNLQRTCPNPKCPDPVKGWLSNGLQEQGRRFKALNGEDHYLVVGRYKCLACSHAIQENNDDIMAQLPLHVQREFPYIQTGTSGCTKEVACMITALASSGVAQKAMCSILNEINMQSYLNQKVACYDYVDQLVTSRKNSKQTFFTELVPQAYPSHEVILPDKYDKAWISTVYAGQVQPENKYHEQLTGSLCSYVGKADAGFGNSSRVHLTDSDGSKEKVGRGTVTVMTAEKLIIAQWHGSDGGLWVLTPNLANMSLRLERNGMPFIVFYTDSPKTFGPAASTGIRTLGMYLFDDGKGSRDSGNKDDVFHQYGRITDTFKSGHPLAGSCMAALRGVVLVVHPDDHASYITAKKLPAGSRVDPVGNAAKYIRVMYLPPAQMLEAVKGWAKDWHTRRSDTGVRLFTVATCKAVLYLMDNIVAWRTSDGWVQHPVTGECRLLPLYNELVPKGAGDSEAVKKNPLKALPQFASGRGTPAVENIHSSQHGIVVGTTNSPQHVTNVINQHSGRANLKALVAAGKQPDYRTFNMPDLLLASQLASKLGLATEYGEVRGSVDAKGQVPEDTVKSVRADKQGYAWLPDNLDSSRDALKRRVAVTYAGSPVWSGFDSLWQHCSKAVPAKWAAIAPHLHKQPTTVPPLRDWLTDQALFDRLVQSVIPGSVVAETEQVAAASEEDAAEEAAVVGLLALQGITPEAAAAAAATAAQPMPAMAAGAGGSAQVGGAGGGAMPPLVASPGSRRSGRLAQLAGPPAPVAADTAMAAGPSQQAGAGRSSQAGPGPSSQAAAAGSPASPGITASPMAVDTSVLRSPTRATGAARLVQTAVQQAVVQQHQESLYGSGRQEGRFARGAAQSEAAPVMPTSVSTPAEEQLWWQLWQKHFSKQNGTFNYTSMAAAFNSHFGIWSAKVMAAHQPVTSEELLRPKEARHMQEFHKKVTEQGRWTTSMAMNDAAASIAHWFMARPAAGPSQQQAGAGGSNQAGPGPSSQAAAAGGQGQQWQPQQGGKRKRLQSGKGVLSAADDTTGTGRGGAGVKPMCHKCMFFDRVAVWTRNHTPCPHADKVLLENIVPKSYMKIHNIPPPSKPWGS